MKKLLFVLFLLCGCSTPAKDAPKSQFTEVEIIKDAVIAIEEPIQFKARWSSEFFKEWFATTNEWPTQADVDAWEARKGHKK
jgi:hypothetical protein